jgi:hypothetical protein
MQQAENVTEFMANGSGAASTAARPALAAAVPG